MRIVPELLDALTLPDFRHNQLFLPKQAFRKESGHGSADNLSRRVSIPLPGIPGLNHAVDGFADDCVV